MAAAYERPTVTELGRLATHPADAPVAVEALESDGWRLLVVRRENGAFDATLFRPDGSAPYMSAFRRDLGEAIEKACAYLGQALGAPRSAGRLRLLAMIETGIASPVSAG